MNPLLLELKANNEHIGKEKPLYKDVVCSLKFLLENAKDSTAKNGKYAGNSVFEAIKNSTGGEISENNAGLLYKSVYVSTDGLLKKEEDDLTIYPFGVVRNLIDNQSFSAYHLDFKGRTGLYEKNSFLLLYILYGGCMLSDFDSTSRLNAGNLIFVPADTRVELSGVGDIILVNTK